MVKYALTKNPAEETSSSKSKKFTHLECGSDLKKADDGRWFCVPCRKIGYLVKPD